MAIKATDQNWETRITEIKPNHINIKECNIVDIIKDYNVLEAIYLIITGTKPSDLIKTQLNETAIKAARKPWAGVVNNPHESISKFLAKCLLMDEVIPEYGDETKEEQVCKTVVMFGRFCRYLAYIFGHEKKLERNHIKNLSELINICLIGKPEDNNTTKILEAMIVASMDHGVTPPSAQATLIAASVRAAFEVCISSGICAITNVHGGAGQMAAKFFKECISRSQAEDLSLYESTKNLAVEYLKEKRRIKGLGHRIHTHDPRINILWSLAKHSGFNGEAIQISEVLGNILEELKGKNLPVNVDGVIGAIVVDMKQPSILAKVLFIMGRIIGLSAHYYEEIEYQPQMRPIDFTKALYITG